MTDVEQQREWEAAILTERDGRFTAEAERDELRARLAARDACHPPSPTDPSAMSHPTDEDTTRTIVREAIEHRGKDTPTRSEYREILSKLEDILTRLGKGDTRFELLEHRVAFLEKIIYGACGVVGLAVIGGLIALIMRSPT